MPKMPYLVRRFLHFGRVFHKIGLASIESGEICIDEDCSLRR